MIAKPPEKTETPDKEKPVIYIQIDRSKLRDWHNQLANQILPNRYIQHSGSATQLKNIKDEMENLLFS